jgi:hypothetical protein
MTRLSITSAVAWVVLSGCGVTPELGDAQLLVPEDVSLHWDLRFNEEADGLGALIPLDVMVYEEVTGEPLDGVSVKVLSEYDGIVVVPLGDVVRVDVEGCDGCDFLWDAWRDQYFEYDSVEGDDSPGVLLDVMTDEHGLARVYLYADSFPSAEFAEDGDFLAASVLISTGIHDETLYLVPQ